MTDEMLMKLLGAAGSAALVGLGVGRAIGGAVWKRLCTESEARVADLKEQCERERVAAAATIAGLTATMNRQNEHILGLLAERERENDDPDDDGDTARRRRRQGHR